MGPAPGSRIEEVGLRKKKGCLGRALLSSLMWSLLGLVICSRVRGVNGLRVVPAYAHDL